jgi:hypothetical protein
LIILDAVYTERINGLKKNVQSVRTKRNISMIKLDLFFQSRRSNLRNKTVAIVHGTADGKIMKIFVFYRK